MGLLVMFLQVLGAILALNVVASIGLPPDEVNALMAFKNGIYEDPFSVLSSWNGLNPCNWTGVHCSATSDHVITLNLSSLSLNGFIAPDLCHLTVLKELILHNNTLIGTIPQEIGFSKELRVLDLSINRLSGPIPHQLGNLTNISKINLHSNDLTGAVPSELGNLRNLVELRLDRNKLQGMLPGNSNELNITSTSPGMYAPDENASGSCMSPQLLTADFSYNFFVGDIPMCLKYLPRSSFQGNCLKDKDARLQRSSQQCAAKNHQSPKPEKKPAKGETVHHGSSKPSWLLALEIVTGSVVGFLLLFATFAAIRKCRPKSSVIIPWKKAASMKEQIVLSLGCKNICLLTLFLARLQLLHPPILPHTICHWELNPGISS